MHSLLVHIIVFMSRKQQITIDWTETKMQWLSGELGSQVMAGQNRKHVSVLLVDTLSLHNKQIILQM